MTWTDEQIAMLTAHFKDGTSCKDSANELSRIFKVRITKNMVIGKRSRLGLRHSAYFNELTKANAIRATAKQQAKLDRQEKRDALTAHRQKRSETAKVQRAERRKKQAETMVKDRGWKAPPTALAVSTRDAILSLRRTSCRYPIGNVGEPEFRFCGEPKIEGSSYCAKHRAICSYFVPLRIEA